MADILLLCGDIYIHIYILIAIIFSVLILVWTVFQLPIV